MNDVNLDNGDNACSLLVPFHLYYTDCRRAQPIRCPFCPMNDYQVSGTHRFSSPTRPSSRTARLTIGFHRQPDRPRGQQGWPYGQRAKDNGLWRSIQQLRSRSRIELDFRATNNTTEYERHLVGLRAAASLGFKWLIMKGDSELVTNQVRKDYDLIPNCPSTLQKVWKLEHRFDGFEVRHVYCKDNADTNNLTWS